MKLTELRDLIYLAFESTPSESGVSYGCDCGCGGDYYIEHDCWDEAHEEIEEARKEVRRIISLDNLTIIDDTNW